VLEEFSRETPLAVGKLRLRDGGTCIRGRRHR
jgi:hypothetical protein